MSFVSFSVFRPLVCFSFLIVLVFEHCWIKYWIKVVIEAVLGAPYLPLCHPEWVWLWGLGGFIALFKGLGRQLFNFRWWWGFLYRPSPAGRSPWVLWRNSTTTAAWARAPASLCAAFSARWGRALASNSAGGLSAGFWPYELWNLLLGGFLLGWRSLYLGCLITAWGPGEWTGPWGG